MGSWNPKMSKAAQGLLRRPRRAQQEGAGPLGQRPAWAALEILPAAVEKVGLDRKAMRDHIAKTEFDTVLGKMKFNGTEEVGMPGMVGQWQNGEFEIVWPPARATAAAEPGQAGLEVGLRQLQPLTASCLRRAGLSFARIPQSHVLRPVHRPRRGRPGDRRHLCRGRARPEPAVRPDAHHEHRPRRVPHARRLPHLGGDDRARAGRRWFIPPTMVAAVRCSAWCCTGCSSGGWRATSPNADILEARSLIVGFGLMFIAQNAAQLIWGGGMSGQPYLTEPCTFGEVTFAANRLLVLALSRRRASALSCCCAEPCRQGRARLLQAPLARSWWASTRAAAPAAVRPRPGAGGPGRLPAVDDLHLTPSMGEPYTISALIVITLGGLGNIPGAIAGGLLLGLVETFGMYYTSPSLKILISYGVLVLVLLLRPNGLFHRKR